MTTSAENERLAVLENQYRSLQSDVTEIKSDVKALVAAHTSLATALAVKEATDARAALARGTMGVWVRATLPWLIAVVALVLAIYNTFLSHA
jgi:hypothetical protein